MKNTKSLEAIVGLFVVAVVIAMAFLVYKVSQVNTIGKDGTYTLHASFSSVSGLKNGASVMMAGVKIGKVDKIRLSNDSYKANVRMKIDNKHDKLPIDTSVSVLTAGLLGEKYLGLDAGAFDEYLSEGDEIDLTKSSVVLERLIDQFFYRSSQK